MSNRQTTPKRLVWLFPGIRPTTYQGQKDPVRLHKEREVLTNVAIEEETFKEIRWWFSTVSLWVNQIGIDERVMQITKSGTITTEFGNEYQLSEVNESFLDAYIAQYLK